MKSYLILTVFFLTSCSLAPFGPTTSGRSAGKGNIFAQVGNVNSSYHLNFAMGLTKEFDLGFTMEFGEISTSAIHFKYSFLNNEVGPSLATEFGYGSTETTKVFYGGLTGSLAFSKEFELFVNGRVSSVSTDETDIEKDKFHGNIKITDYELTYLQLTYGLNVWFNKQAGLSLYSTYFKGNNLETKEDSIFGGSFLFKF